MQNIIKDKNMEMEEECVPKLYLILQISNFRPKPTYLFRVAPRAPPCFLLGLYIFKNTKNILFKSEIKFL